MSMSRSKSSILALAPIFIGMCAAFPALAATPIDQTRSLDPRGRVEIDNLKGRVEVRAWDRPEVKITGSLGAGVEKLSVEGDRGALHIEVKYPNRANNTEPTVLVVQVPLQADLEISTVSANIDVHGVAPRELSLESVSGDIVANGAPRRAAVESVSGDVVLTFNSGDLMPMVKNTSNRLANFTPIAIMAEDKQLLFIGESAKYKTFDEVIKAVKSGAKVVIAGSKGDDVATYEKLIKELKFTEDQLAFIVNDSTSAAITSILGGHVDLVMSKPAAADQYVVAGKLTPVLALSSTRFTGNLRDAPRLSEVGSYQDVEFPVWRGVVGPKTMSPEAAAFWAKSLKTVAESEAWQKDYIGKFKLIPSFLDQQAAKAFMTKFEQDYLKSIGK